MIKFKKGKSSKYRKVRRGVKINKIFNHRKSNFVIINKFSKSDRQNYKFNDWLKKMGGIKVKPIGPAMQAGKDCLFVGKFVYNTNLNYTNSLGKEIQVSKKKGDIIISIVPL